MCAQCALCAEDCQSPVASCQLRAVSELGTHEPRPRCSTKVRWLSQSLLCARFWLWQFAADCVRQTVCRRLSLAHSKRRTQSPAHSQSHKQKQKGPLKARKKEDARAH